MSSYGSWWRTLPKVSSVKEWWCLGREEGEVEPTQVDTRRERCTVCAWSVKRGGW